MRVAQKTWAFRDARHWQILAVSILALLSNIWSDFGSGLLGLAAAVTGALGVQFAASRLLNVPFDWRSPLITAFAVALLLRAPSPLWHLGAAAFGIAAKWTIRWRGKHVFNPGNIAVVASLLASQSCWISPGQWGDIGWWLGLIVGLAALVLSRANRLDICACFLLAYGTGLVLRANWLGDPMTIPLHQLQSGALIIFSCFMITDPRSTPDHRFGRMLFAILVAALAIYFQIRLQLVGAPLYALALLSPLTPIIDMLLKDRRFEWRPQRGNAYEAAV